MIDDPPLQLQPYQRAILNGFLQSGDFHILSHSTPRHGKTLEMLRISRETLLADKSVLCSSRISNTHLRIAGLIQDEKGYLHLSPADFIRGARAEILIIDEAPFPLDSLPKPSTLQPIQSSIHHVHRR